MKARRKPSCQAKHLSTAHLYLASLFSSSAVKAGDGCSRVCAEFLRLLVRPLFCGGWVVLRFNGKGRSLRRTRRFGIRGRMPNLCAILRFSSESKPLSVRTSVNCCKDPCTRHVSRRSGSKPWVSFLLPGQNTTARGTLDWSVATTSFEPRRPRSTGTRPVSAPPDFAFTYVPSTRIRSMPALA